MKFSAVILAAFLIFAIGIVPSAAQYGYESETDGYSCWACPVCGYVVQLDVEVGAGAIEYVTTLSEVMVLNPYDPDYYCPVCGVYGGYFVLVPCSDYEYDDYDDYNDYDDYDEYEDDLAESDVCEDEHEVAIEIEGEEEIEVAEDFEETSEPGAEESVLEPEIRILMVLPPVGYNDVEYNVSRTYFEDQDFDVELASSGVTAASGMMGGKADIDFNVSEADVSDYDAVVFIGGTGIDDEALYDDPDYIELAQNANDQEKVIGAICLAPKILANATILDGKNATVSPISEAKDYIRSKGAIYSQDKTVLQDGNIITASGPSASRSFAEAIATAIRDVQGDFDVATEVAALTITGEEA